MCKWHKIKTMCQKGISKRKLARTLKISGNTVNKYLHGSCEELVIDNAKQMVIVHKKNGILYFNDKFLLFCGLINIDINPCKVVRRGKTKGNAEKPFYYMKEYFEIKSLSELYNQIEDYLKALKLKQIIQTYNELANKAIKSNLSYKEYLVLLLENEFNCRIDRSVKVKIAKSKFPFIKTLEEFGFSFQPSLNDKEIIDWNSLNFVDQKENILFWVPPGVGKAHITAALVVKICFARYTVLFMTAQKILEELSISRMGESLLNKLLFFSERCIFTCHLNFFFFILKVSVEAESGYAGEQPDRNIPINGNDVIGVDLISIPILNIHFCCLSLKKLIYIFLEYFRNKDKCRVIQWDLLNIFNLRELYIKLLCKSTHKRNGESIKYCA